MKLSQVTKLLLPFLALAGTTAAQSGKQSVKSGRNLLARSVKTTKTVLPARQQLAVLYLSPNKTLIVTFHDNRQRIASVDVGTNSVDNQIINNNTAVRLMAKKAFKETNLTIFSNGRYYGYLLRYAANQVEIVHYLDTEENLEKQTQPANQSKATETLTVNDLVKEAAVEVAKEKNAATAAPAVEKKGKKMLGDYDLYDSVSSAILERGLTTSSKYAADNGGCEMLVGACYVHNDKLYFALRFSNTSSIAYDIDFVKFGTVFIKKSKNQAEQESELTPLYEFGSSNNTVASGNTIEKVFVFDKFTIDKKTKQLKVEAWEKNGERVLSVKYSAKNIINADQL